MRNLALATLLLVSCDGATDTETQDTEDTGTAECSDNPDASVPEEYRCLWELSYSGCTTSRGGAGKQVYYLMEGRVEADGSISGESRIWWFYPDEWVATDCVDTVSLTGQRVVTDLERLGCGQCEEAFEVTRAVTQDSCSLGYNVLFEEDEDSILHQTLLFDTHTSNGDPNEEGKVLVFHRTTSDQGVSTKEYARGNIVPDGAEHEAPYTFTWLGSRCMSR